MKYKFILITGGAGFIGSNLAISFKRKYPKVKVLVLDNLKRRGSELNIIRLKESGVSFLHADIRNPEDLVFECPPGLLIECSAEPSVMAGVGDNPLYVVNTNLTGTVNCLELARKRKLDVIFLSTSRVYPYGAINEIKARESAIRFEWSSGQKINGWSVDGINESFTLGGAKTLYGATKLCSEILLQEYIQNYGIKGVVNRCGVVAGPWQFGKVDQGIFTFLMLAHFYKKQIKYIGFGGKGKQVRDILHVDDLLRLIDLEAGNMSKVNAEVYNIGGGNNSNLSLIETVRLCEKITGSKMEIKGDSNTRPGDIKIYISDSKKVAHDLGWQPQESPGEILEDIFSWIKENDSLVKESLI
ncbi:MAG: NAD-dependent epimerase/dehydratase family protein [Candidatus Omnitrophica bacterium]|nr:NAD-dependent epimerase/dehydratase family protein [Candidatus Omnitrophota bacterium]